MLRSVQTPPREEEPARSIGPHCCSCLVKNLLRYEIFRKNVIRFKRVAEIDQLCWRASFGEALIALLGKQQMVAARAR